MVFVTSQTLKADDQNINIIFLASQKSKLITLHAKNHKINSFFSGDYPKTANQPNRLIPTSERSILVEGNFVICPMLIYHLLGRHLIHLGYPFSIGKHPIHSISMQNEQNTANMNIKRTHAPHSINNSKTNCNSYNIMQYDEQLT